MFKVSKKKKMKERKTNIYTLEQQIYSKLAIKTQEHHLMLLLLTTHFAHNSTVIIVEFDQINAGLA